MVVQPHSRAALVGTGASGALLGVGPVSRPAVPELLSLALR